MTLRKTTFQALCLDYTTSLSRHGFKQIYLISRNGYSDFNVMLGSTLAACRAGV